MWRNLTRDQAAMWQVIVRRHLRHYGQAFARVQERGGTPGDPLFRLVRDVHHALHALHVHLHYTSCGQTIDAPPGPEPKGDRMRSAEHLTVAEADGPRSDTKGHE